MFNFDPKQRTVPEGLGISTIRMKELIESFNFNGKSINDAIKATFDSDHSDSEKLAIFFEIGANFGENVAIQRMKEEAQKSTEQVLSQLKNTTEVIQ